MSDVPDRALVFDLSGPYGHYKRIYATTTALTLPVPTKTAVYGLIGAIMGLPRHENAYLERFSEGECRIALQLLAPVRTQRMTINLRPGFGAIYAGTSKSNRKPTLTEFLYRPSYRLFVTHRNPDFYASLRDQLSAGRSAYTPTLGLANLIAQVRYRGEAAVQALPVGERVEVDSIIPKSRLDRLHPAVGRPMRLVEVGQYAVEMLPSRDVTVRDEVLFDRGGNSLYAEVRDGYSLSWSTNERARVILF
jgi:CRISPR-associated protein Cas5h